MKFKRILDVVMTALFIVLMGYHIVGGSNHEIIGAITLVLLIVHNVLNYRWYKTIGKGKYKFIRLFSTIVNILLLIAMIAMMISGIMISSSVFAFLNIPTSMLGRSLHMISTSWGFVLMSIHVGIHLRVLMIKINNYFKKTIFDYVNYLVQIIIVCFGIYAFIKQNIISDMFLLSAFKMYDYNQPALLFYIELVGMIMMVTIIIYYLFKIMTGEKYGKQKNA